MKAMFQAVSISAVSLVMAASAQAQVRHHKPNLAHHQLDRQPAVYQGPGSIVFNRTVRSQHEPGVTEELAPDAKQTATGGPSGGVPGFDGN